MARNAQESKEPDLNLLELVPERVHGFTTNDDGLVRVLVPRFKSQFMRTFFVPRSREPFVHVKLDKFGTLVWNLIDGARTVARIADALTEEFGEEVAPAEERLAIFIRQMRQYQYIRLKTVEGREV